MSEIRNPVRVPLHGHDIVGLGRLRRCRAIAQALVEHGKDLSVLVPPDSPIVGGSDPAAARRPRPGGPR